MLTGGGRLARVDVADDDDVDMALFLTAMGLASCHCCGGGGAREDERPRNNTHPMVDDFSETVLGNVRELCGF
jgi:hypothetical protein